MSDNPLVDWFDRMMPEAMAWFNEQAEHPGEPVTAQPVVVPMDEPLNAVKLASYIEVPDELLMDYGLIPDTRPKPPPLPWRWRLRNKLTAWRERAARRAYKTIAGDWPDNREDDW